MKPYLKIILSLITFLSVIFLFIGVVNAFGYQGCCSSHEGIDYCDNSAGRLVCNDGTYSPSCTCPKTTPPQPPDGSITFYTIKQCVDKYNELVNKHNEQTGKYNQSEQLLGKCSLDTIEYEKMLEQKGKEINDLKETKNWLIGFLIFAGIWIIYLYYENRNN